MSEVVDPFFSFVFLCSFSGQMHGAKFFFFFLSFFLFTHPVPTRLDPKNHRQRFPLPQLSISLDPLSHYDYDA